MLMATLKKLKFIVFSISCSLSLSATALEPLPDRAQVQNIYATLLLPDGSHLNTDISFDCGSKFEKTGIIITTEEGAKFLAQAYTQLYGVDAGKKVMQLWKTKAHPEDPRKPTMLLINNFNNNDWPSNEVHLKSDKKVNLDDEVVIQSANKEVTNSNKLKAPEIIQLCGTRVHNNYVIAN
ncbi:hypothetical protein D0N37_09685 [Pseudoalteromonas piscicida]|nr:hypothetical protein D0N37_09685 [Pseudoalteromonas piscicida]